MPDSERVDQPRQIVAAAAIDLRGDIPSDFPELPRPRAVRPRIARRHDQILERRGVKMVHVGKIADETTLEELIDERLSKALDVHRRPRRKVLQAAAKPGRAGRVRAAPDDFLLVPLQVALTHGTGRRHLPWLAAGSVLAHGLDDLGNHVARPSRSERCRPRAGLFARCPRRCAAWPSRSSSPRGRRARGRHTG